MEFTCLSASDAEGNLIFYSNGISIRNINDDIMEGGDGLNPGWMSEVFLQQWSRKVTIINDTLALDCFYRGYLALLRK